MNFFDNIKLEKKFNLITANFYKELDSCPSRVKLSDFILKSFNYSNINNLKIDSLFEVSQTFIDQVICTKSGLFKKIQFLYENKNFDLGYIHSLIDANKISSIININYDNSFCDNSKIKKLSPFDKTSFEVGKTKLYKPLGDLITPDTCVITKQDFRKLKVLPFYKNYFDGIRYELKLRKNIILAFDIEDSDFFEILDFVFGDYPEALNDIYMVVKNSITDNKILSFIKKYNIQVLKYEALDFLEKLDTSLNINPEILEENKKEVQFSLFDQPIDENVSKEEVLEEQNETLEVLENPNDISNVETITENKDDIKDEKVFETSEDRLAKLKEKLNQIAKSIEGFKEVSELVETVKVDDNVYENIENNSSEENKTEEFKNIEDSSCEEILETVENTNEEDKFEEIKEVIEEISEIAEIKEENNIIEEKIEESLPKEEYIPKDITLERNEFTLETALEKKYSSSGLNTFPIFSSNIPEDIELSEIENVGSAEMKVGEHINSSYMRILSTKDKKTSLLEIKSRELRLRFSIIFESGVFKVTNDYFQYEISSNTTHGRAIVVLEMLESLFGGTPMEFSFKNLSGQISLNNPTELIKIKSVLNLFRLAKTAGIKIQMNKLENIPEIFYKLNLEILLQDKNYSTWCNYETTRKDIHPEDKLTFRRVFTLDKKNIEEIIVLKKPVAEKDIVSDKVIGKSKVCTVYLKKIRGEF